MTTTKITFLLCDNMLATSISLPLEQLRAAQSIAIAQRLGKGELEFKLASIDGKPVKSHTGMILVPDCSIHDLQNSEITYLPALWRNPKPILRANKTLSGWLKAQYKRQNIIAGVGTGCCFMAEAGLLDHRPATTHWYYLDEFQRQYPSVKLVRDYFITQSDNIYCAASVNSLADLTIQFIQNIYGAAIARLVERHFFHEFRQAYRYSHHLEKGHVAAHPDEEIALAQQWLEAEAQSEVSIKEIAERLGISLRSFNRRFKQATQQTPLQYKQSQRMDLASQLLQTSNLSISEISEAIGYQDVSHFSELFRRHFSTSASQYRATVRSKLFNPGTLC